MGYYAVDYSLHYSIMSFSSWNNTDKYLFNTYMMSVLLSRPKLLKRSRTFPDLLLVGGFSATWGVGMMAMIGMVGIQVDTYFT